jgi:peptidoglycan/LPS O-acetylase OafA/YrhL
MKALRIISLLLSCMFLFSAITGVQHYQYSSSDGEVIDHYRSWTTQALAFAFGILFGYWYWTLKNKPAVAKRITSGIFVLIIAGSLLDAVSLGFRDDPPMVRVLLICMQILCTLFYYWLGRKGLEAIGKHETRLLQAEAAEKSPQELK